MATMTTAATVAARTKRKGKLVLDHRAYLA